MVVQAQLYPESLCFPFSGLQDCMVNNLVSGFGTDFCFALQESQQQNLFLQPQSSQNFGFDCNNKGAGPSSSSQSTCDSFLSMALAQHLDACHLEIQRQENERLRSALQEQRRHQLAILLKNVESKAISLMRQKEEDLAQARKKMMELETCLRKALMERESWQRVAGEKEAMVIDLSNTLEQVRERLVLGSSTKGQDTESFCCGSCDREQEDPLKKMACKGCNSRASCILFLPCKHLCSCNFCEAFLPSCPVCESPKEGSMEVFWV
ncbi:probable BOI-related E3 ubiquitin-protein ligase 2 isoform X2 [Hevea brasiliensis]|uniref:probable BOI-related E3 ubiquitin-protein ligase 2 isoform X2 n=1 Tax=Hevea brasiliensis TaxID=3981 RepID=UPI002600AE79|nr:probable BOI-related E3 ubiquitin-protein ligase 2 isoform X2 [Hevea brasiliensis]